jgi:hypothetical protein
MSDELLDKPGTTPAQTGEPEPEKAEDSERPEGADREAEVDAADEDKQDRTDWKGMALGLKGRLEEVNRRLEDESRLRATHTSPTVDPQMAQNQAEMERIQQAFYAVKQGADAGDPASVLQMALLTEQWNAAQERLRYQAEMKHEVELLAIPDADEREQLRQYWYSHRNEHATIKAARKAMLGERYESERAEMGKKTKQAEEVIAKKGAGGVKTYFRDVPHEEVKARRMTESDYDTEISTLRAAGDMAGLRAKMRERLSGAIKLTQG